MPENDCIRYSLAGFKNLTLTENLPFVIDNNHYINAIQFDDDLTKITVYLKSGVHYLDKKPDIDLFVNQILFNLIAKTEIDIEYPSWYLESVCSGGKIELCEAIAIQESVIVFKQNKAENIYRIVTNSFTGMDKHSLLYNRIFYILKNQNIVVQFMSLYEILLENSRRIVNAGRGQKNVAKYLELHKDKYPFISFQPSRDPSRGWEEDTFTYIRNEIGHCEETNDLTAYKQAGSQITPYLIKNILIVLNDVIMLL